MEENGLGVVKCFLSDNLASDSKDERHLLRVRRETTSNFLMRVNERQKLSLPNAN